MKIAQIAPITERVPPKKYGGTERVIYALTEELTKRGHDVTLFASGDSATSAKLVSVYPKALREARLNDIYGTNYYSLMNGGLAYSMHKEFDVIHDHNPGLNLPAANLVDTPVVMTWHGPFSDTVINYFKMLDRPKLAAISISQKNLAKGLNIEKVVYNGLDMSNYPFSEKHGDYLLFVGRIDMEKGTHLAIDVAVSLNKKLVIAAKLDDDIPHIRQYFEEHVRPRLEKYPQLIDWVGEVEEEERNNLMKNALCLLHPITWPEPFGLVMIEAMACGTPVVALDLGSVSEVVVSGKTGFVAKDFTGLVNGVKKIERIGRRDCREHSLTNFSASKMAEGYEDFYKRAVDEKSSLNLRKQTWTRHKKTDSFFGNWGLTRSGS
jgi:glycosyltransferase involved in cell wall biosynthesis